MTQLHRFIGPDTDIPAGDIGVSGREISYMFGHYLRLENQFHGVITGKGVGYGGSLIRKEATGYGCVYFAEEMLKEAGDSLKGKKCVVSGSGNVALYTAEKLLDLGATVLTLSDSSGFIHDPDGIDREKLEFLKDLKEVRRGRIHEYTEKYSNAKYFPEQKPWIIACDAAFPCATQNELDLKDAEQLVSNGLKVISEGANMPSTFEAVSHFRKNKILYGLGKAANAGGVAVSGLEQTQNAMRLNWTAEEVDRKLQEIMANIHKQCLEHGKDSNGYVDYFKGANIAGFKCLADAIIAYGVA